LLCADIAKWGIYSGRSEIRAVLYPKLKNNEEMCYLDVRTLLEYFIFEWKEIVQACSQVIFRLIVLSVRKFPESCRVLKGVIVCRSFE
jgi:hypothetical protein